MGLGPGLNPQLGEAGQESDSKFPLAPDLLALGPAGTVAMDLPDSGSSPESVEAPDAEKRPSIAPVLEGPDTLPSPTLDLLSDPSEDEASPHEDGAASAW